MSCKHGDALRMARFERRSECMGACIPIDEASQPRHHIFIAGRRRVHYRAVPAPSGFAHMFKSGQE
ncbi:MULTISPECIES: hypothetical protein [Stenotrophomonas]|uniref:hypothetical protein n=1 Tax=Stenotrophomonas TaxID=40323 RepID=UPI000A8FBDB8|nr:MULTISPECIES: hypothetical protein [Stenotrophomonas]